MGLFNFGKKKEEKTTTKSAKKPEFCMWKPTKSDFSFKKSYTIELIDYLFDVVEGYELLAFNGLSLVTGKRLDSIPENETYLTMKKDDVTCVVSLSKDKGLRFYFDYNKNTAKQIQKVLRDIVDLFMQNGIAPPGLPSRPPSQTKGKEWWQQTKVVISKQPEKDIVAIGVFKTPP